MQGKEENSLVTKKKRESKNHGPLRRKIKAVPNEVPLNNYHIRSPCCAADAVLGFFCERKKSSAKYKFFFLI